MVVQMGDGWVDDHHLVKFSNGLLLTVVRLEFAAQFRYGEYAVLMIYYKNETVLSLFPNRETSENIGW